MEHGSPAELKQDNASDVKARIGLVLFVVYGLVYAVFVIINTVSPKIMNQTVIFDLNLAVVFGFSLILLAIIMGLIYNAICTHYEKKLNTKGDDSQ